MTETVPVPAIDFSTFDHEVRIADDLYRHVNGRWIAETTIDDDKPMAGAFIALRDAAEAAVRDIITGITAGEPGSNEAKIADLYASFMDTDAVEAAGAKPLSGLLAEV
ncbi:MAG TPA: M13 family metallopeptidase N-terminal domain-containing protein, partial [Microlunatus sp.]|nr:M13 family metallopeptidase N-terminal domain-containing protein [Microlunatus sp.]